MLSCISTVSLSFLCEFSFILLLDLIMFSSDDKQCLGKDKRCHFNQGLNLWLSKCLDFLTLYPGLNKYTIHQVHRGLMWTSSGLPESAYGEEIFNMDRILPESYVDTDLFALNQQNVWRLSAAFMSSYFVHLRPWALQTRMCDKLSESKGRTSGFIRS